MKQLSSENSEFPSDAVSALRAGILNNNNMAVQTACTRLKPFVEGVARTYCKMPADLPHFEQVAITTIARAAQRFDHRRGKPIEHLIRVAVKRAMLDEVKKEAIRSRRVELVPLLPGEENDRFQSTAPSPAE